MVIFVAGGPLNPTEHQNIIVRRPEFDIILNNIENSDLYIALTSPRQTGKTTLLYQIRSYLNKIGYGAVYIDLENYSELDEDSFYPELCDHINSRLFSLLEMECEESLNSKEIKDANKFFKYLCQLSESTPKARKLVLILDEIGGVPNEISKAFFSTLRKVLGMSRSDEKECLPYRKIFFIFSGALDLHKLTEGRNSPLSNVCQPPVSLDDFSKEQVLSLCRNLQGYSNILTETISENIYKWCNGHPYLTQRLLCLIEKNQFFSDERLGEISSRVENLVEKNLLFGKDSNLSNILHYLERNNTSARNSIFRILYNKELKTVDHDDELLVAGLLRRLDDQCLDIRNQIYLEALKIFFEKEEITITNEKN